MSEEKNVKFKCPYCKRVVFDTWISYLEHNGGVKCPMCKTGFSVILCPTQRAGKEAVEQSVERTALQNDLISREWDTPEEDKAWANL